MAVEPVAEIASGPAVASPESVQEAGEIASDSVEPIQQVTEVASNTADAEAAPSDR